MIWRKYSSENVLCFLQIQKTFCVIIHFDVYYYVVVIFCMCFVVEMSFSNYYYVIEIKTKINRIREALRKTDLMISPRILKLANNFVVHNNFVMSLQITLL